MQHDLWFDQQSVMEALTYLDKTNKTNLVAKHNDNWIDFTSNKPNWKKEIKITRLEEQLKLIEAVIQQS